MQWQVEDKYLPTRIDDKIVDELKCWLKDYNVQALVTLEHCDPYFWLTTEQINSLQGPVGLIGARGPIRPSGATGPRGPSGPRTEFTVDERPVVGPASVVVSIKFILSNEHAEQLKSHKLNLTTNPRGETLPTWRIMRNQKQSSYCCGVYKREGFDNAFNAMKILKPHLTPETFAMVEYDYDTYLVSLEPFHGHDNCLTTFRSSTNIDDVESTVILRLSAPDVLSNIKYLTTLLSGLPENK